MLTFLHSKIVPETVMARARAVAFQRRSHARGRSSAVTLLLLFTLAMTGPTSRADDSPLNELKRKRITTLRRNETPEGSRLTFTSDAPLDDYKFYVEGERLFVLIPRCALVTALSDLSGRGFTDMRVEQRDGEVILSFRLQPGSTVAVNQSFNRLAVIFMTNERANPTS